MRKIEGRVYQEEEAAGAKAQWQELPQNFLRNNKVARMSIEQVRWRAMGESIVGVKSP
jgi:hypothetical protein